MKISNWYPIQVCIKCKCTLSDHKEFYSRGVCPFCGHNSESTICNTKTLVIREIKHYKWWQLWNRKKTYQGNNVESKEWLDNI